MNDSREKLKDAFEELPICQELSFLVDNEVRWLIRLAESKRLPSIPDPGWNKNAQQATQRFSKLAAALHECMSLMPPSAIRAIAAQMGASAPWALPLLHMAVHGSFKALAQQSGEAAKKPVTKSKGGRPVGPATETAGRIAEWAAESYTLLTRKPATPGCDRITGKRSEFERFLSQVFNALAINASAEVQAKARRRREKTAKK